MLAGILERLTELGTERATFWGWPNIYTYTKSLGEQLVAAEGGIAKSIVRPSIVESSKDYPFPGWNEGFTTTAPLIFIALKGQSLIPVNEKLILDITPDSGYRMVMQTSPGWIASMIMGRNAQMGALANIVVGIVGALIGGVLRLFRA